MDPRSTLHDILRALMAPRRAALLAVAAVPLLWAQPAWNTEPLVGLLAGLSLIVGALGVGPAAWRILGGRPGRGLGDTAALGLTFDIKYFNIS